MYNIYIIVLLNYGATEAVRGCCYLLLFCYNFSIATVHCCQVSVPILHVVREIKDDLDQPHQNALVVAVAGIVVAVLVSRRVVETGVKVILQVDFVSKTRNYPWSSREKT